MALVAYTFFLLPLGVPVVGAVTPVGPPWTLQTAISPWGPRTEFSMVTLADGSILVMGGEAEEGRMNDVWLSSADDAGKNWNLQTDNAAWSIRKLFGAVSLRDGSVIVMGGFDGGYQTFNDVWRSTDSGRTWSLQSPAGGAGWSKRVGFAAVSLRDDSIIVMGGVGGPGNDVWRSAPGDLGVTWTRQVDHAPWDPRAEFGVVVVTNQTTGDEMIMILGGRKNSGSGSLYMQDVWLGSADGSTWDQRTAAAPWAGRMPSVVATLDGSVWIVGGGSYLNTRTYVPFRDVWRSRPESYGAEWTRLTASIGWSARLGSSALITRGKYSGRVLLAAGMEASSAARGISTSDVWRTKLPCEVQPPLEGSLGNCPVSPAMLEADLTCQPECNLGYSMAGNFNCSDGLLLTNKCDADPCDASAPPLNGDSGNCTAHLDSWSFCQPTCNEGYTISGPSYCELGSLTRAYCSPNPCSMEIPSHGTIGDCIGLLQSGQNCQPQCHDGYLLSGPTSCFLGILSKSACLPKPCHSANAAPLHGSPGDCPEKLESSSTCFPTCDEGFNISGATSCFLGNLTQASCLPKSCDTSEAQDPSHGTLPNCPQTLSSGSTCELICDSGYDRIGVLACHLGNLSKADCSPKPCTITSFPIHGGFGNCSSELLSGELCEPSCSDGYYLSDYLRCALGNLSNVMCLPKPCNSSGRPINGERGTCTNSLPHGQTCQPTCDNGFTSNGATTCSLGNLTPTVCDPNPCSPVLAPDFGGRGNCPHTLQHQAACQPTCMNGYTISGRYRCFLGTLSTVTCKPNPCEGITPPSYGMRGNCPSSLLSGHSCEPACDIGYSLVGLTSCFLGNLTRAACEPDPCNNASIAPLNGQTGDCPKTLLSGQECYPQCNFGYTILGRSSCDRGRMQRAECTPKICYETAVPDLGSLGDCPQRLSHGVVCQPSCHPGYVPSGPTSCIDGNFTGTVCLASPCNVSTPPENGNQGSCQGFLESGSRCQPECNDGYSVSGETSCYLGATTAPTCNPSPCNVSAISLDNQIGLGNCPEMLLSGESCLPECRSGFSLSHALTCRMGVLGIATLSGVLRTASTSSLECHPGDLPICTAQPCFVGEVAGSGCPLVLPSGSSCINTCKSGYNAIGRSSCFLGELTLADCFLMPDISNQTNSTRLGRGLLHRAITTRTTTTITAAVTTRQSMQALLLQLEALLPQLQEQPLLLQLQALLLQLHYHDAMTNTTSTVNTTTTITSWPTTRSTRQFLEVITTSTYDDLAQGNFDVSSSSTSQSPVSSAIACGFVDGDGLNLFSFLLGAGAGMVLSCCLLVCGFTSRYPKERKNKDDRKDTALLPEVRIEFLKDCEARVLKDEVSNEEKLEQQRQSQIKANKEHEAQLSNLQSVCDSLNEQLQTALRRNDERENELEITVKQKEDEQVKLREEVCSLGARVSELSSILSQEGLKDTPPSQDSPALASPSGESDVAQRSNSELILEGDAWQPPPLNASPVKQREDARLCTTIRCLLEGSFVEVLPGMQLSEAGEEICASGDIGIVQSSCQDSGEDGPGIVVLWIRSGKTSTVFQASWTWFRFITPAPELGDFLQALPGAGVDVMGEEVSRVGDVGEIVGADTEGIGALRISWPRTGKTYDLQPTSRSWYRFFKACQKEEAEVAEEIEQVSGNGIDRTSSSNESGISMLWIRAGSLTLDPKEGDTLQVPPGTQFIDEQTTECHHAGAVATVIGRHAKESGEQVVVVSWMWSGHTSTIARTAWKLFRFFRKPELRVGDLLLLEATTSSQTLSVGDAGSVLRLKPRSAFAEESIQIYWMRIGEVSECPMSSWSNQFRWIPIQKSKPSHAGWPLSFIGAKAA